MNLSESDSLPLLEGDLQPGGRGQAAPPDAVQHLQQPGAAAGGLREAMQRRRQRRSAGLVMGGMGRVKPHGPRALFEAHFLAALLLWLSWGDHQLPEPLRLWAGPVVVSSPRGSSPGCTAWHYPDIESLAPLLWAPWGRWRILNGGCGLVSRMWPEIQRFWAVWAIFV